MGPLHTPTTAWYAGAIAALLLAVATAPAVAVNQNLTATARYSASSEWESDKGNTAFVAGKAFDGDLTTRWNVASSDGQGSWLAATWDAPVTINKVVVREAFDRLSGFRVQRLDAGTRKWVDASIVEGSRYSAAKRGDPDNPTFSIRLPQPIRTPALRILFTRVRSSPSIFEVEAWNNPAGTLTGTVTDPSGNPIERVTIRAGDETTSTSADGKYTLVADAGQYDVIAGKRGVYRDRTARAVELPANGTAVRDFVLQPLPPNLALSATAVSSSDWEDGETYNAAKANDGSLTTRWNSFANDADGAYLELQWPQPQTFNQVTVREAFDRIRNYTLERYDEATDTYLPVLNADVSPRGGDPNQVHPVLPRVLPAPVTSRRLRLAVNLTDAVPSVFELEVRNTPVAILKGVVTDSVTGRPVRRASITGGPDVVLGEANDRGEFLLRVEPGDYVVSASEEGYLAGAPLPLTVDAGETREMALTVTARGANIAPAGRASASSSAPGGENGAGQVNDGDLNSVWLARASANQWVAVTWDRPVRFIAVQLRGFQGVIQRSFLQVLDADGKTWVDLPETTFSPQFLTRPADFFFPQGVTTRGVRYFITATHSTDNIPGLAEMMVFEAPTQAPIQ